MSHTSLNILAAALEAAGAKSSAAKKPVPPPQVKPGSSPPVSVPKSEANKPTLEPRGHRQPRVFDSDYKGLSALIVPAMGFDNERLAWQFHDGLDPIILSSAYAPFNVDGGRRWYVPHTWDDVGSVDEFLVPDPKAFSRSNQPRWLTIWKRDEKMPEGGYTVMVLAGGRRQFFRHVLRTTKHPKWWYRIASGPRDCFVVWRDSQGQEMRGLDSSAGDRHIYITRSAKAVVYAKVQRFANDGSPDGYEVFAAMIKTSIFERDNTKDPAIRVEIRNHRSWLTEGEKERENPFLSDHDIDPTWHDMVNEAMKGFDQFCQTVPEEVEQWRQFYLDQTVKLEADRRNYSSTSFQSQLKKLGDNWRAGLRLVREAWQLAVCIDMFSGRPEFMEVPNAYSGARYSNVGNMLKQSELPEARLTEFYEMIGKFIEPRDGLWNYTGD